MLTEKFEEIFTQKALLEMLEIYSKEKGYASIKASINSGAFQKTLAKGFVPDPLNTFEIPKSNGEMRELVKASTASKIVQKVIADALSRSVKFNDKSYAFRKGKGTLKAVNRTRDFLQHYDYVAKADIDNFFDSINQEKLIVVLNHIIVDKKITALIALFLKNGMMKEKQWIDKHQGVYQGDNLSPILSNIYLHSFDVALENKGIEFVRFADDMLFFAKSKKQSKKFLAIASSYLKALDLSFGEDKSYLASKEEGFEFLGLRFKGSEITMDNERLMKKLSTLSQKSKHKNLEDAIDFFNKYTKTIRRYYLKILTQFQQLVLLDEHIDTLLIAKIIKDKKSKRINNKSRFVQLLMGLEEMQDQSFEEKKQHAHSLIARAYEVIALEHPLDTAVKTVTKKKSNFLQEQIKNSEIILNGFGLYVSINRGKIVVKEYGKVIKSLPVNWVTRIVVMTKGASLSSALIFECSKRKIDIDFIEKQKPYAQITYYDTMNHELHFKQMEMRESKQGLDIAKSLIKAKMKNQINLIKYHARYREENDQDEFVKLDQAIVIMEKVYIKMGKSANIATMMGLEGSVSVAYWKAFGILIDDPEFHRETHNAPDAINQALNYGYAFLYHRMQSALHRSGVNIYHSFMHVPREGKPTLVFDMIEPFRQPVVDREIISILNRGTKINSSKGRLDKKSIKVITENVQERLATPTRWRKGKYKILTIVDEQALEIAHVIQGVKAKFKGFVVRY